MFATFAIILLTLYTCKAEQTLVARMNLENQTLAVSELSFNNEALLFALCNQTSKQCNIIRMTTNPEDHMNKVNLKADSVQLAVTFDKQKAIAVTLQSMMLKSTIIYMSNGKIVEEELFEIPSNWKGIQLYRKHMDLVLFDDGFEMIVKGFSKICTEPDVNKYCAFRFDTEGRKTEGPYVWPKGEYDNINVVSPILMDASGKGYFFINENVSLIGVQTDRKGGPTHVKLWGPLNVNSAFVKGGLSTANNANGACFVVNCKIECWQNDAEGGLTMQTEFTFEHQHEIWNIYIHNLREGGFNILVITCPDRLCQGIDDHYYMMKIDANGKANQHAELNMKKSQCNAVNGSIYAKILEVGNSKSCVVLLCHKPDRDILDVLTGCY